MILSSLNLSYDVMTKFQFVLTSRLERKPCTPFIAFGDKFDAIVCPVDHLGRATSMYVPTKYKTEFLLDSNTIRGGGGVF